MKITKKLVLTGTLFSGALLLTPLAVSAHNNKTNDMNGVHVAAEDNHHNNQTTDDKKTPKSSSTKKDDDSSNETEHSTVSAQNSSTSISLADATVIAMNLHPDVELVEAEKENEHGKVVYEFEFADGSKVTIDADTSIVLSDHAREVESNEHKDTNSEHRD